MLRSRSKSQTRLYLNSASLLPDSASGLPPCRHSAASAADALLGWLHQHDGQLRDTHLHVELAGSMTRLFCLPFSSTMDSPATVRCMAQAYASNALGAIAPLHYQVAEPLIYGCSPVILGLDAQAGDWSAITHPRVAKVESYALAMWNRHAQLLPDESCWLVVLEPTCLTCFFKEGAAIDEVLVRKRPAGQGELSEHIKRIIRQQFHRPGTGLYLLDEFELLGASPDDDFARLPVTAPGFSQPTAEATP